ncbi:hypothetical protein ABZ815_51725 [Nonomuraea sp. NPDC047529]|uniref:hypothetical protein n=1 Tax=Nonomuraea sp. NPDC047529 TaxID=3155623 RepID=UPI0033DBA8EF
MDHDTDLWNRLAAHGIDFETPFRGVWCEGLTVEQAAHRLGADPDTARPGVIREIVTGEYRGQEGGVVWIGDYAPGWILAIQLDGNRLWEWDAWARLSGEKRRLLSLGWPLHDLDGVEDLQYLVGGELVTSLVVGDPEERDGSDPDALDDYLDGLSFFGDTAYAEVTSALRLIGRITGREIDDAWLDGTHTRYAIRESSG